MTGFTQIAAAGPLLLALGVCLLAGLVSFASPCVVPLVPGYLSYLAAVVGVDEQPPPGANCAFGRPASSARWRVVGSAAQSGRRPHPHLRQTPSPQLGGGVNRSGMPIRHPMERLAHRRRK